MENKIVQSHTTAEEIAALAQAAWQVLDDMGAEGQSCCRFAKAQLRVAFEPFIGDMVEIEGWMTLADAERIVEDTDHGR